MPKVVSPHGLTFWLGKDGELHFFQPPKQIAGCGLPFSAMADDGEVSGHSTVCDSCITAAVRHMGFTRGQFDEADAERRAEKANKDPQEVN